MWKASLITYEKYVQRTDRNKKHYCAVLFDSTTNAHRVSKVKHKTASDVMEYAKRFNNGRDRELSRERKRPNVKLIQSQPNIFQKVIKSIFAVFVPRAQGVDVSHWDGEFDPERAAQPIHFAVMKLTEGTTFVDSMADSIWQGVKKVSVRGGYHYQRSGMSWLTQANHYLNVADRFDFHFHVLDLESIGNTYSNSFFADTRRILDYWKTTTSKKVVLYTNISTYEVFAASILNQYSDGQQWLDDLTLWIAWPSLIALNPLMPKGRTEWTFWQYRWDGPPADWGTDAFCDVNVFNGSVEQLQAWADVITSDEEPPDDEVPPDDSIPPTGETMTTYNLTAITSPTKRWSNSWCTVRTYPDIPNGTKLQANLKISGNYGLVGGTYVKGTQVRLDSVVETPTDPIPPTKILTHTIKVYDDGSITVDV